MKMRSLLLLLPTVAIFSACVPIAVGVGAAHSRREIRLHQASVNEQIIIGNARESGYEMLPEKKAEYAELFLSKAGMRAIDCPIDEAGLAGYEHTFCAFKEHIDVPADMNPPEFNPNTPIKKYLREHPEVGILELGPVSRAEKYRLYPYSIRGVQVVHLIKWRFSMDHYFAVAFPH